MTRLDNIENFNNSIGYSDGELEKLSRLQSKFESGFSPWLTWESENSSFGKIFREWGFYPRFLPLFFSSDHGVHWESKCWPNEVSSPYSTYFTWNAKKNKLMRNNHNKKSYHVPHPWIFYRKKHFPTLPNHRSGTLVFYAHSNTTTTPRYENLDKYINDLKSLPDKYQPISICLSFHDINKGLHKKLRKYNLPLVTAGITNSRNFVDRFYSMIYKFKYCTSSHIGSHTFYIVESGIPFFIYGPYPEFNLKGSKYVKDGPQDLYEYGDENDVCYYHKLIEVLSVQTDQVTPEQYNLISIYLGLKSNISRLNLCWIMWREFFRHIDEVIIIYLKISKRLAIKFISIIN